MHIHTRLERLTSLLIAGQFNVDKVDLEFPVGLDTNQQGRTSSRSDNLVWEVNRLEDESKGSFLETVSGILFLGGG